jgi:hypothetical protein
VPEESGPAAGGMSPDQLLAEFEARLREVEAAGGEAPSELKRQLERIKRMMAAGQAEGIQFMQAGDHKAGLMGFSVPLESGNGWGRPGKGRHLTSACSWRRFSAKERRIVPRLRSRRS